MNINDVVKSHERLIYKQIRELNIRYDIEDYMQVGRIAIVEAVETFDESRHSTLSSKIYGVVRSRLIDEIRRNVKYQDKMKRHFEHQIEYSNLYVCTSNHSDIMLDAKRSLSKEEYELFVMIIDGYSLKEIAKELNKSTSTVKMRKRNVLDLLKTDI